MANAKSRKYEIAKARLEKAAAKRERRLTATSPTEPREPEAAVASQQEVLAALARLHERFDRDEVDFVEFETQRQTLIGHLVVE